MDAAPAKSTPAAKVTLTDAVARKIEQNVTGDTRVGSQGEAGLPGLAEIKVTDGVVKEIHQTVQVILVADDAEDWPSYLARQVKRPLETRYLFVACGREIRAYDPRAIGGSPPPARTYRLPPAMGSTRSVRLARVGDRIHLLAGARLGVALFGLERAEAQLFPFPSATRHGANSMAILGEWLYAAHSDLGLLRWPLTGGEATPFAPDLVGAGCRAVQVADGDDLLVCARNTVWRLHPQRPAVEPQNYPAPAGETIVGAVPHIEHLFGLTLSGRLLRWDRAIPGATARVIRDLGAKAYDLSPTPPGQSFRLVPSLLGNSVCVIRPRPPLTCTHYQAPPGLTLSVARAAPDLVAALDKDYTRLCLWNANQPEEPRAVLPLHPPAKPAVADLSLLSG